MSVVDDLLEVRSILARRGRCRERGSDADGRVCLGRAVVMSTDDEGRQRAMLAILAQQVDLLSDESWKLYKRRSMDVGKVTYFNDQVAGSDDEVFELIDKAIANA